MKKLFLITTILAISLSCKSKDSIKQTQAIFDDIKKEIKSEYAPDRREKVFEAELEIASDSTTIILRGSTTEPEAKKALLEALKNKNITVQDSMILLPDQKLGDKIFGITSQSVINFRYGPGYANESATQTILGMPLRVLEKKNGWTRAITPEGYIAWVSSGGIAEMNESEYNEWIKSPKLIVTVHYTLFREQPSENSGVVLDGVWGNIVRFAGESGNYYKVILPDGKSAYLQKAHSTDFAKWIESRNPTADNIIATAKQLLGFPYMWGGTSIKAVDCSGFMKTAYYLNGIILERDASQQALTGEGVDISNGYNNLQKGDLLFFGSKAENGKKERITHVGMYIGEGRFIHSAGSVKINSLDPKTPEYSDVEKRLVRAQRILTKVDADNGIVSIKNHKWYFPVK